MESEKREAVEKARREAAEEMADEIELALEDEAERKYRDMLLLTRAKLGFITQEELEKEQEARKKGKR